MNYFTVYLSGGLLKALKAANVATAYKVFEGNVGRRAGFFMSESDFAKMHKEILDGNCVPVPPSVADVMTGSGYTVYQVRIPVTLIVKDEEE